MTYLSAKKIYPGNWAEPLNGWYKNIDTNDDGTNNASKGGPTSVLAVPGFRRPEVVFHKLTGQRLDELPVLQLFFPELRDGSCAQIGAGNGASHGPQRVPISSMQHRTCETLAEGTRIPDDDTSSRSSRPCVRCRIQYDRPSLFAGGSFQVFPAELHGSAFFPPIMNASRANQEREDHSQPLFLQIRWNASKLNRSTDSSVEPLSATALRRKFQPDFSGKSVKPPPHEIHLTDVRCSG